ncbi:MAG: cytochrome c oxidase subunit II, partial [Actinomycetota bacterium]|nr:cytochrome c oxidase subunit II [Actinomycetota bacterium]
ALSLAIFVFGVGVSSGVKEATAEEGMDEIEIDAVSQQWLWRFEYPEQAEGSFSEGIATIFSYGELVVPVDTVVNLNVDSTDVVHSWFVPALGPQVWAVPGEIQETSFIADEEGVYRGTSTVFSGAAGYPVMRATVRVVSAQEYEDYIDELNTELQTGQDAVSDAPETDLAQEDSDETSESEAADAETGPDETGLEDGG